MESWRVAQATRTADEETSQEGFVQEFVDIFWVHAEASDAWVARHFKGGRRLTK